MNVRVHLNWLRGMWRCSAGTLLILKSILGLPTESLGAFDIYHIIEAVLEVMVLFWHGGD